MKKTASNTVRLQLICSHWLSHTPSMHEWSAIDQSIFLKEFL